MMAASTSLLFLVAPLVTLFYFSGTCAAAFRPSGETIHRPACTKQDTKKKHFFVREKARITTRPRFKNFNFLAAAVAANDESASKTETTDTTLHPIVSLVGKTTSIVVATSFFLALAYFRNAVMISFWLGAICNAILSKVLKKVINQSRPPELGIVEMAVMPSDGGMPSSHAMSLAFIGTMTALLLPSTNTEVWAAVAMRLTLVAYASMSLYYRVQVKFHTWEQIAVGVAVGAGNASLFYYFLQPSLMTWLSANILNDHNCLLPVPMLLIPIVVGLLVVGSVERRIAKWFK
jgi:membrane-associated phospholipid phosphatase